MATSVDAEIRSYLRRAQQIEINIDRARRSASQADARRREYERRVQEVRKISHALTSSFDSVINNVRRRQADARGSYEDATVGLRHEGSLTNGIERDTERAVERDSICSQILENLRREIARCENEISNARAQANQHRVHADNCCTQRRAYIERARQLSRQPDATVHVRMSTRY